MSVTNDMDKVSYWNLWYQVEEGGVQHYVESYSSLIFSSISYIKSESLRKVFLARHFSNSVMCSCLCLSPWGCACPCPCPFPINVHFQKHGSWHEHEHDIRYGTVVIGSVRYRNRLKCGFFCLVRYRNKTFSLAKLSLISDQNAQCYQISPIFFNVGVHLSKQWNKCQHGEVCRSHRNVRLYWVKYPLVWNSSLHTTIF